MRVLRLALGGLWGRQATSAMLLVIALVTTTAAAAAPSYASSARDAILQAALRRAPVGAKGTGVAVTVQQVGTPSTEGLRTLVDHAFTGSARAAYPTRVLQLSVDQRLAPPPGGSPTRITLIARDDVCRALRVTAGACPSETDPNGVVLDAVPARRSGLRLGSVLHAVPLRGGRSTVALHVRGIATRASTTDPSWFGAAAGADPGTVRAWVPAAYFSALKAEAGDGVTATADLLLDVSAVHVDSERELSGALDAAVRRIEADPARPTVTTEVQQAVARGLQGGSRLAIPILVAIAELLALGWFLLHAVIGSAAEARGAEIALSKVRGLSPGRTLLLVLLEPALLLGISIPLGVLLASGLEHWLVPRVLGAAVDVPVGWSSWGAAAVAAAGGLVAAGAASIAVFRRPVLDQWRRTRRVPFRRGPIVEVVVVALAAAGILQLRVSGALGPGSASGIAVLAPMLLILAGALVASRAVVLLARSGFGATRATGAVGAFVGLRQLVRRPAGRRTFGVLVVATALAIYGVSSAAVLASNRDQRALTDIGAPTVLHIVPDPATDRRVSGIDPTGRVIAAVSQAPVQLSEAAGVFRGASRSGSPAVLVVDPATFGRVAYWRDDFGSVPLRALLKGLRTPAPVSPTVTGTTIALDITAATVPRSLDLAVDLTDRRGAGITASFGTLTAGSRTYSAAVKGCAAGCSLRRIYVDRPADRLGPFVAGFTVHGIRGAVGSRTNLPSPAFDTVRWSPLNPTPDAQVSPAETVRAGSDGLRITIAVSGLPEQDAPGFGAVAGAAPRVPALLAAGLTTGATTVTAQTTSGSTFALRPAEHVAIVPRLGDAGVVLPRDWLAAASPSGSPQILADQLWIAGDAPFGTLARLRAAGVRVRSVENAGRLSATFASQGPAFSTALVVAAGVTATLMAAASVILGLSLLARRRVFELSAMRALGIRTRSLLGSVLVEQAALVLVATACGLLLGIAGVQLALPALPAYVDDPSYPAFVVHQPLGLLLLVSGAVAAVLLVAVAVTAAVLTRSASVARLREAEQ